MPLSSPLVGAWDARGVQTARADRRVRWVFLVFGVVVAVLGVVLTGLLASTEVDIWWRPRGIAWDRLLEYCWPLLGSVAGAMFAVVERQRLAAELPMVDEQARTVLEEAVVLAGASGRLPTGLDIFTAALSSMTGKTFLARLGVRFVDCEQALLAGLQRGGTTPWNVVVGEAFSVDGKSTMITVVGLLHAAFVHEPYLEEVFQARKRAPADVANTLEWLRITEILRGRAKALRSAAAYKPTTGMDRAMTARPTPTLNAFSEDMTLAAVYGRTKVLVGREKEMTALFRAIEGARASVVLVGEAGVGKGALLDGLADLMVEEAVPKVLQDKRLVRVSVARLAASGAGADERLLTLLMEAGRAGNVVLAFEDIHDLVAVKAQNGLDLASLLARELEKGYVTVIATTTPAAWAQNLERHALGARLTKVSVSEPERDEAIRIVGAAALYLEGQHGVFFTYVALAAAVDLSLRYAHEGALPQTAIQLAAEAANAAKRVGSQWVTDVEVAAIVTEKTHVPVAAVQQDEADKLLHLEEELHHRVIGQEVAVSAVASALRRARANMRSEKRPIASFLFLGPTGVGKTELAKATAATYFGNEQSMVRFDMSEFQSPDSAERLIGRQGEAGLLTEAVRRQPFALVLLDELEKADAEVLNLFLQVMDDGRLTDGLGRTVDFTNTILIATSNAGTQYIQDQVKVGAALLTIKQGLMEQELRGTYKPEFLNRFNDVIVFSPLRLEDVVAIAYLMVATITKRLAEKGIHFSVSDAAVHELAEAGFDPLYGARPLRRTLEERVENALADALLRGEIARRDTVVYDVGGHLAIQKAPAL